MANENTFRPGDTEAVILRKILGQLSNVSPVNPVEDIVIPIGAVVAWYKSTTGVPALPAQFLECNGQVVNDAGSPINGQTLPNLNGGHQFLRGNSASGSSGGAATHAHAFTGTTDVENGDLDVQADSGSPVTIAGFAHVHPFSGVSDFSSSLPPYSDVVWIIRIK